MANDQTSPDQQFALQKINEFAELENAISYVPRLFSSQISPIYKWLE
jgi:hypothetical protein